MCQHIYAEADNLDCETHLLGAGRVGRRLHAAHQSARPGLVKPDSRATRQKTQICDDIRDARGDATTNDDAIDRRVQLL